MIRLKWPWFFEGILYWFIDSETDFVFFCQESCIFFKNIGQSLAVSRNRLFSLPKVAK